MNEQFGLLNEVQVFDNSSEFSNIRILNIDNEPWFVGKDVCNAFGDTNYRRSISNIDDSDKSMSKIDTAGGKQNMVIINESGLYSLLFQMQPQKGVSQSEPPLQVENRVQKLRRFKKWVTGTVLPQIRKTGSYEKPMSTAEQIQLLAKGTTELNERVGEIEEKVTSLEYDMPLYGCEIDEVQKHIKRKGIEILGGKDSAAYKDASIRSSLYSDMYKQLKREYGCVATYKSIKRKYIADVHDFIDCYEPPRCLEEQILKGV